MNEITNQYTLDKHKRPQSLDDLVAAGYLKEVPAN
jgi:competence protein ComGC